MVLELNQITTNDEYEMACNRIDEIFQAQDGPEAEELDRLATLVDAYEEEHFPIGYPDILQLSDDELRRVCPSLPAMRSILAS